MLMQLLGDASDQNPIEATEEAGTYFAMNTEHATHSLPEVNNAATKSAKAIPVKELAEAKFDYAAIPAFDGEASVVVNDNMPFFTDAERRAWVPGTEVYPDLDERPVPDRIRMRGT